MPSVRELLESAAPYDARGGAPAAEVRRAGRRRQHRSRAWGVLVAVTAVALATVGVVRFVVPSSHPVAPTATVAPSPRASFTPQPAPSPSGPAFAALTGTRWIVDLVNTAVSTEQAYPEEKGGAPRALLTFEAGHVLVLDYIESGRTTTVRGSWLATSRSAPLDGSARGDLRLVLATPRDAPTRLGLLLNRLSLTTGFAMVVPDAPPPSLAPLTMALIGAVGGIGIADLVKPGYVLPSPYPSRP